MQILKDLADFVWAVINNWAGYATGGIIIFFTTYWYLLKGKTMSKEVGIALAAFFLFLAFFKAWKDEHNKVRSDYAYLQCTVKGAYDSSPFLENQPIAVSLIWQNKGNAPARDSRPFGKIYLKEGVNEAVQQSVISEFAEEYKKELNKPAKKGTSRWIFPSSPDRGQSFPVEGPIITDNLLNQILEKKIAVYAVGIVRFTDGRGVHEAHACQFLRAMTAVKQKGLITGFTKFEWGDCQDFTTQEDIK